MDQTDARFGEFFRELVVAARALASYPPGHPAAAGGLAKASAALASLLAATGPVELGATKDALLWADRRFASPAAAQLAKLLRRRRAAGVVLEPSASASELETFLRALTGDARSARSLAEELSAAGLVRIRVRDLDFSSVALVDADEDLSAPEAGTFEVRLVRRLLSSGALQPEQVRSWASSGMSAADLLHYLLEGGGQGGGPGGRGQGTADAVLAAVAADFCEAPSAERAASVAGMHRRLGPAHRERLAHELGAALARQPSARESLAVLSAAFSPQGAAELGQAAARAAGRGGGEAAASPAPGATASPGQLSRLRQAFTSEDVDAFRDVDVPVAAVSALLEMPEDPQVALSAAAARIGRELAVPALDRDIAGTLLEIVARTDLPAEVLPKILARIEANYLRLLSASRLQQALAIVEGVHWGAIGEGPVADAFRGLASRLADREAVQALVASLPDASPEALTCAPTLVEHLDPGARRHLLEALAAADERRLRLRLVDLLAKLGSVVARDAAALLSDPRWYVVRNMLLILRQIGDSKSVPAVRKCTTHPDLRVRLEAIHNLFAFDREGSRELLRQALHDADLREAQAAMSLAGKYGIAEAVEPIVAYLRAWDPFGRRRAVRLEAIRALGAIGDPAALDGLKRFRAGLIPPAREERRELYRSLSSYPKESREVWIESGRRSRDVEIRWICETLVSRPGGTP